MPVWVTVDGRPVRSRQDAEHFIGLIHSTLTKALALSAWNNEAEKQETRNLYAEAASRMAARRDESTAPDR